MAHEINNPLAIIASNLGLLRTLLGEGEIAPDDRQDAVESLEDSITATSRIEAIVKILSSFDHRQGQLGLSMLDRAVIDALTLLSSKIPNNIRVETELENEVVVALDSADAHHIVIQLIRNAIAAMQDPREAGHQLVVRVFTQDNEAVLQVSDTGRGISKQDLGRIFDPFFTSKLDWRSTGLGLTLCRNVVQSAGGHIEVRSEQQQGTDVSVFLPLSLD